MKRTLLLLFSGLIFLSFMSGNVRAQITVSGAGSAAVNGTYTAESTFNGKNLYGMGGYEMYWETGYSLQPGK